MRVFLSLSLLLLPWTAVASPSLEDVAVQRAGGEELRLGDLRHRGWFALRFLGSEPNGEWVRAAQEAQSELAGLNAQLLVIAPGRVDAPGDLNVLTDDSGRVAAAVGACWDGDPGLVRDVTVVLGPDLVVRLVVQGIQGLSRRVEAAQAEVDRVDLRPAFRHFGLGPRRQGRRPTCSVFTTVGTLEFAFAARTGKGAPMSVEYLNWASNQVTGNRRSTGQFFHNLWAGFSRHGICLEADLRYRRSYDPKLGPSDALQADALARREGVTLRWLKKIKTPRGANPGELRAIKLALAQGRPVAAGSSHSVLLVGYRPTKSGGEFIIHDSGTGKAGTMTYARASKKLNDVFVIDVAPGLRP